MNEELMLALIVPDITLKSAPLDVYKAHRTYVIFWFYARPYGLLQQSESPIFFPICLKKLAHIWGLAHICPGDMLDKGSLSKSLKNFSSFVVRAKCKKIFILWLWWGKFAHYGVWFHCAGNRCNVFGLMSPNTFLILKFLK